MVNTIISKLKQRKNFFLLFIILFSLILFFSISLIMKSYSVYKPNPIEFNGRFYSYDEIYYTSSVFVGDSKAMNELLYSSIKHPLFMVGANIFTKIENKVFPSLSFENHYYLLVIFQILISIIGVCFLYLILVNVIKTDEKKAFFLSLVYVLANSVLISTVLVESFVYSATLLIMSYYFIATKRYIISGILGVLAFGTTITNVAIWAIMVIFLGLLQNYKSIIKIGLSFIFTLMLVVSFLYFFYNNHLNIVFNNFISIALENGKVFSPDYNAFETIKRVFYYLFISPLYYIDTSINTVQAGVKIGHSIFFTPSANIFIIIVSVIFIFTITLLLVKKLIQNFDKNILTCFFIILFNIILHGFLKFGINEGFLYTPHLFFTFIILFAIVHKYYSRYSNQLIAFTMVIIFFELIFNFKSIIDMVSIVNI